MPAPFRALARTAQARFGVEHAAPGSAGDRGMHESRKLSAEARRLDGGSGHQAVHFAPAAFGQKRTAALADRYYYSMVTLASFTSLANFSVSALIC